MSDQFNNDVLCGAIFENGEYAPIYCNSVTGECYFPDPVMSYNRLISELSADSPVEVDLSDIVAALEDGAYGECIGVIYNGETFSSFSAMRKLWKCRWTTPYPMVVVYSLLIFTVIMMRSK